MNDISTYLERRAYANNAERVLFSEDGLSIAVTAGLGASHYNELREMKLYHDWEDEFSNQFGIRMTEFEERRFEQLEEYKNLIDHQYVSLPEDTSDVNELDAMSRYFRYDDINTRWDFEQFFAMEGNEGARRVLGYHSYEEGKSVYQIYSEDEFQQLTDKGRVAGDGATLEGHHIMDVRSHTFDTELLDQLYHTDNIRLMTREAHLRDPNYGHGGNWSNTTTGEAREVIDRYDEISKLNRDIVDENLAWFDLQMSAGIGVMVGTVSAAIELIKLRKDPRPWKKRVMLISAASLVRGFEAGTLALVALKIRTAISSKGESEVIESVVEYANNVLTAAIPGGFDTALDVGNLSMYTGFSISIASLRIIRSGITAIAIWRQSSVKVAKRHFRSDTRVILTEESVFWGGALLLDVMIDAAGNTVVPDPTLLLITCRLFWSVLKKYNQNKDEQMTLKICKKKKLDALYESCITALVYLG